MRIIGGRWRGKQIAAPPGTLVRPTTDKVREAWLSMVHPYVLDARVLDLFAGSGALGLEALSRGAKSVDFIESDRKSLANLEKNIAALGASASTVHRTDVLRFLARLTSAQYDLAFADPPYRKGLARAVAEQWLERRFSSVIGIEHESEEPMPPGGETRRYGGTSITLYGGRFSTSLRLHTTVDLP